MIKQQDTYKIGQLVRWGSIYLGIIINAIEIDFKYNYQIYWFDLKYTSAHTFNILECHVTILS